MLGIRYAHIQDVVGGLCEGLRDYVQDNQSACHGGADPQIEGGPAMFFILEGH
jgi:hypothetical protein